MTNRRWRAGAGTMSISVATSRSTGWALGRCASPDRASGAIPRIVTKRSPCCVGSSSSASTSSTPPTPTVPRSARRCSPKRWRRIPTGGHRHEGRARSPGARSVGPGRPARPPAGGLRRQPATPAARADPAVPVPPARSGGRLRGLPRGPRRAPAAGQDPPHRPVQRVGEAAPRRPTVRRRSCPCRIATTSSTAARSRWSMCVPRNRSPSSRGPRFRISTAAPIVGEIAARHEATEHQVALAWLLARSPTMVVIPGTGSRVPPRRERCRRRHPVERRRGRRVDRGQLADVPLPPGSSPGHQPLSRDASAGEAAADVLAVELVVLGRRGRLDLGGQALGVVHRLDSRAPAPVRDPTTA